MSWVSFIALNDDSFLLVLRAIKMSPFCEMIDGEGGSFSVDIFDTGALQFLIIIQIFKNYTRKFNLENLS
jgi:hypothetical protein